MIILRTFILILAVWVLFIINARKVMNRLDIIILVSVSLVLIPVSYYASYQYSYFSNSNTRWVGYPCPSMIWQRTGPDAPWADFIGPTIILAPIINFIFLYR